MYALFSGRIPLTLDILKASFNNFKNDSDHVIVKYSLYSHTTIYLTQLFKKIKKWWKFTRILFFLLIDDSRIKRKLGTCEKKPLVQGISS